MEVFLLCFIPLFVAIDPPALVPMFMGMTADWDEARRRRAALEAVPAALVIGGLFFWLGAPLLNFIGIRLSDLQIAGGSLLFVFAMMDLFIPGKPAVHAEQMHGLVPLATPMIAGPAVLTLGLVLSETYGLGVSLLALAANLVILLGCFLVSGFVMRYIPVTAFRAVSKVVDLLLAAIGVAIVREGVLAVVRTGVGGG